MQRQRLNLIITGTLLAGLFFMLGVFTLPSYGINWDTINHLPRGQAYLNYFLTGYKDFSNLEKWSFYQQKTDDLFFNPDMPKDKVMRVSIYQDAGVDFNYFMKNDGNGHPPLSDIISSAFNFVFFQKLGIINDIDAYRLYGVFLAATLVFLIYYWVSTIYGSFTGFIAALSLSLYPLFWAEMHFNNEKDIPETVYISWLLFCFYKAINNFDYRFLILTGIFGGLALGTKFNVLFVPFIIVPWLLFRMITNFKNRHEFFTKLRNNNIFIPALISLPVITLSIFFLTWPYLWIDSFNRFLTVTNFYQTIGTTETIDPRFITYLNLSTYPIQWIIYTTPLVIICFTTVGIIYAVFRILKYKDDLMVLFLLWLALPIIRVTLPNVTIYGGVRQIMEYIPAMAIFSGIGAYFIINAFSQLIPKLSSIKKRYFLMLGILLLFIPISLKLLEIHPNENVYFNPLISGLSGAKDQNFPSWGNTFGGAYRQGVVWINNNAPPNSRVAYARELIPNIPKNWFRRDIKLHNNNRSGTLRKGEYIISLNYQGTDSVSYFDRYLYRMVRPVKQFKVDNVSVLNIWINSPEYSIERFLEDKQLFEFSYEKAPIGTVLKFPRVIELSKLLGKLPSNCITTESAYVQISLNGIDWERLPGVMPKEDWSVPQYKDQPNNNSLFVPFAADKAKYIQLVSSPQNSCLDNLEDVKIYYFE